ncbi:molybdopterin dehydrogenase FAD-binding protein [Desulfurococcus mucosus DSM 2162]|uniref:Molybdopterin dehydrogenase FAD-binding protein n=1 Tax=Desulfurococcus mucosus (strain ATCC 35584 / DSM 2162 / JCM 9187 / O7/1) TaxID=765177 RepID=E8R9B1_DESM0|nr:molybdopterin dehydrogenase FAD-binding protein [Desulfurococcus mucosus DSM 2162]
MIRDRRIPVPRFLVDLSPLKKDLSYVKIENGVVRIGALTTLWEISRSTLHRDIRYAGFTDVFKKFGTMAIRFNATIGGNIASATQYSDYITLLLVYDARLRLESASGVREVSLEEFLVDKRTTIIKPNELITEISFREPPSGTSSAFIKFDRRELIIAGIVTGAFYLTKEGERVKDVRIAFDMVKERRIPGRARMTEECVIGKTLSESVLREAESCLEREMKRISDWWTSDEYRLDMSKTSLRRGLLLAEKRISSGVI